jgi:hypothetical protein
MWNSRFASLANDPFNNTLGFLFPHRGLNPLLSPGICWSPSLHSANRTD